MRRTKTLIALAFALPFCGALLAHVRLINPSNGNALFWQSPSNISIVVSSAGSDDIADGSHFTACSNAIEAWNQDQGGTAALLIEDTSPAQQARTDWAADDLHMILFDENDSSGYFPAGSGAVAITPVWFVSSGRITDADVLFNGSGFDFTTSNVPGAFDVQDVAVHELGHLLGLDHSGWAGASLYPYVSPQLLLQRSPSHDDRHGLRTAYPAITHCTITGAVRRLGNGSAVAGANVVAFDSFGRTAGGALTDNAGAFQLTGLDPGAYSVCATPLDFPVSSSNLSGGQTVQTDFRSTFGGSMSLGAGQTVSYGDLFVGSDVAISLGRNYDELPLRGYAGAGNFVVLSGAGLVTGSTLTATDPSISVNALSWMTTQVAFTIDVPAGEEPGHVDLIVTNPSGETSVLPAAIEITPLDPVVLDVSPQAGTNAGGTSLTITGSDFNLGARVVIGREIYEDGVPGGCVVVDSNTILLDTQATTAGTYDVVVIDATGVEGRDTGAYTFMSVPAISSVFPPTGDEAGGTSVVILGQNFMPGMLVRIDGVDQPQVAVDSSTRVLVVTEPGVAGGPYILELENSGGAFASSAFSYAAAADPVLDAVDPPSGSESGGSTVTLTGFDFAVDSLVSFGADPDTGSGGVAAASVTFIDGQTLEVATPSHGAGAVTVMVWTASTGQASVLTGGYTFLSDGSGGGGGGGCSIRDIGEPWSLREAFAGGSWILFALLVMLAQKRMSRARGRLSPAPSESS